jgi:uncharacterized membrane protein
VPRGARMTRGSWIVAVMAVVSGRGILSRVTKHGHGVTSPAEGSSTVRLEAFSDGVFAIAITLLILEIKVPEAHGDGRALLRGLAGQWPGYIGYVLSFVIIGIMWSNHHLLFRFIRRSDHTLAMANLMLMMAVAFFPYPTSVLAQNFGNPGTRTVATVFYSAAMLVTSVPWSWMWIHALRAGLVDATEEQTRGVTRGFAFGWVAWIVTTALAFVVPTLALAVMAIVSGYWMIFPGRRRH